jgi:hypothetical protein
VEFEISPEPEPAERAAILAALEAEGAARPDESRWAEAVLPPREDGREPRP